MKMFSFLRIPLLLLGAIGAVFVDRVAHKPGVVSLSTLGPLSVAVPAGPAGPAGIPDLLERVIPSVVTVYALHNSASPSPIFSPFGAADDGTHVEPNVGSGVIIRSDGMILTNHHVVDNADEVKVVLWDRREIRAEIRGRDPQTDLTLLKVELDGLQPVVFGDSSSVRIGEMVLTLGNALGLGQTVSSGIIGARGRSGIGVAEEEDFFQTDAAMNPGCSGGPLINLRGEMIGINTAIATRTGGFQGIGFVIPSRLVKEIVDRLLLDGKIDRGELGACVQEMTPALAQGFNLEKVQGVIVTEVMPKGPADKAGLRRGDVVISVDGKEVTSRFDLDHRVAMRGPRAETVLVLWRSGSRLTLTIRLGKVSEGPAPAHETKPMGDPGGQPSGLEGVVVRRVTPDMLKEAGIQDETGGVIVTEVEGGGIFAGLRRGDLIVEINGQPICDVDEILEGFCLKGASVLVRVRRAQGSVYLMVPY